jgi:hypothetical protein
MAHVRLSERLRIERPAREAVHRHLLQGDGLSPPPSAEAVSCAVPFSNYGVGSRRGGPKETPPRC